MTCRSLFVAAVALGLSSPAIGQNDATMQMTRLQANLANGNLELRVTVPCGSKFYALVAQTSPDGKNLKLGALIKRHSVACAALPTIHPVKIQRFSGDSYKAVTLMEPENYRAPLVINEPNELRLVQLKEGITRIEGSFSMGCGQTLGMLLKPGSRSTSFDIGSLEVRKTKRGNVCQERHEKIVLEGPIVGNVKQVQRLPVRMQQAEDAFAVKFAPIDPKSLTLNKGNLGFTYLRRCNESPVGVVLGPERSGTRSLGLAVAFYYNQKCDGTKSTYFRSRYTTKHFSLPEKSRFTLYDARATGELTVSRPYAIWLSNDASHEFTIGRYDSCNELVGTLLSYNMQGQAYLGLIEKPTFKACKKPLKELSFKEPVLTSRPSAPEILRFFSRS